MTDLEYILQDKFHSIRQNLDLLENAVDPQFFPVFNLLRSHISDLEIFCADAHMHAVKAERKSNLLLDTLSDIEMDMEE